MPIYEYQCTKCSEVFEVFQKIHDAPVTECKFCHGRVEKLISHTSFQLKGSGWYLTDYANKAQPSSGGSSPKESGKSAEGKSGDSGSTESSSKAPSNTQSSKSSD